MQIIVSGLPGSGKSSLVESLAEEFNLKKIFASGILQELTQKKIQEIRTEESKKGQGFWESKSGQKVIQDRLKDGKMDRALDKKLLEILDEVDNVIVDSRTMPWLSKKGIKIWVKASEKIRAERIGKRDGKSGQEVLKGMRARYHADQKIYKKLYSFNLGKDFEPFHLVIDNEHLDKKGTASVAIAFVKNFQKK